MVNIGYFNGWVDIGSASAIAFTIAPDGRDSIGAKYAADFLGGGHLGSESAHQEASLIFREHQPNQVGGYSLGGILSLINTNELDVRVGGSSLAGCFSQAETNGHDYIVTSVGEGGDILGVIFGIGGFDILNLGAQVFFSLFDAFPCGLVEGFVVNFANIAYQTNAKYIGAFAVRCAAAGSAAGGQKHCSHEQQNNYSVKLFHGSSPLT